MDRKKPPSPPKKPTQTNINVNENVNVNKHKQKLTDLTNRKSNNDSIQSPNHNDNKLIHTHTAQVRSVVGLMCVFMSNDLLLFLVSFLCQRTNIK